MDETASSLSYIPAAAVRACGWTAGQLDKIEVRGSTNARIGHLDGVLIDREAGRLCSFILLTTALGRPRRCELPFEVARLDVDRRTLWVALDKAGVEACRDFTQGSYQSAA